MPVLLVGDELQHISALQAWCIPHVRQISSYLAWSTRYLLVRCGRVCCNWCGIEAFARFRTHRATSRRSGFRPGTPRTAAASAACRRRRRSGYWRSLRAAMAPQARHHSSRNRSRCGLAHRPHMRLAGNEDIFAGTQTYIPAGQRGPSQVQWLYWRLTKGATHIVKL
jgi:hypothetical protein